MPNPDLKYIVDGISLLVVVVAFMYFMYRLTKDD